MDINKSISETEICAAYVDDIEVGDVVDVEIACLGGMLQKIPSLMMRSQVCSFLRSRSVTLRFQGAS